MSLDDTDCSIFPKVKLCHLRQVKFPQHFRIKIFTDKTFFPEQMIFPTQQSFVFPTFDFLKNETSLKVKIKFFLTR